MQTAPQRIAVTFLALGNGAPDLSSAVAAVRSGNYQLALGAQIGSGTFVGCVVGGAVLLVNQQALKAKGAFLRDVSAYALTVIVTTALFAAGTMYYASAVVLLVMYILYVIIVFVADMWHRRPARWRSTKYVSPADNTWHWSHLSLVTSIFSCIHC